MSIQRLARWRSLLWRTAVLLGAAALVTVPAGSAAAGAAERSTRGGCPVVEVVGTSEGFTSPASTSAGLRTVQLTTTGPGGTTLGVFRLDQGVRLDGFLASLQVALTGEGEQRVAAGRTVSAQATFLGGINTVPGRVATFSQLLRPGTYHLINYTPIVAGQPATARPMVVTEQVRWCAPALPRASIEMVDTPAGPRYRAPDQVQAGRPLLVVNHTDQVDEAVLMPIRPDITDADLRRFFAALDANQPPADWPFTTTPQGMPVIHPGHTAIIQPALIPGRYALFTWLIDLDTGRLRAAGGMYRIMTVVA